MTTTSYHLENPSWLWAIWQNGPGADAPRYNDRISVLLAVDTLVHDDRLTDDEERRLHRLIKENPVDTRYGEVLPDV